MLWVSFLIYYKSDYLEAVGEVNQFPVKWYSFLLLLDWNTPPKNILKLSNPPKNQAIQVDKLSLILFVIEHYIPITMCTECYVS